MDKLIKKYADQGNLIELKYIFVDALDVDPTFVLYEEDYDYCKSIPGLLEHHVELTPFTYDSRLWDEAYWTSLKMDLKKNFSDRRMMHMREVAQVFLAEKIARLEKERAATAKPVAEDFLRPKVPDRIVSPHASPSSTPNAGISKAEQERLAVERQRRELDEENRRIEAERIAREQYIEQQRRAHRASAENNATGKASKKAIGIALAVLAIGAVILILILK